ncbi:MAG: helix-turn-helix domain-containing protein, partial [Candidatus Eremiobacteraeota bacterium]|nr:helix-turn-helix domain-containing protein [Candidatus Eremiobacteraeota bacterium]
MASGSQPGAPTFGALLRRFRLSAGLSQEMLAERAELSVEAISTLERGIRRAPYPATIEVLAAALDLNQADRAMLSSAVDRHRARPRRLQFATLPSTLTRLIGRDHELEVAQALVTAQQARLITITGVAGVGKTRFALALASEVAPAFDDGAGFVSLAGVRDAQYVASTLGQLLARKSAEDPDSFESLCALVGKRHVIFVVDNFEHVIVGATLLTELIAR